MTSLFASNRVSAASKQVSLPIRFCYIQCWEGREIFMPISHTHHQSNELALIKLAKILKGICVTDEERGREEDRELKFQGRENLAGMAPNGKGSKY